MFDKWEIAIRARCEMRVIVRGLTVGTVDECLPRDMRRRPGDHVHLGDFAQRDEVLDGRLRGRLVAFAGGPRTMLARSPLR